MKAKNHQNTNPENCPFCGWALTAENENCPNCDRALTAHIAFDKHGRMLFAVLVGVFWGIALAAHFAGYARIMTLRQFTLVIEAGLWGLFFVFIPGTDTCAECGRVLKWIVPERCLDCKRTLSASDRNVHRLARIAFIATVIGITINTVFFFITGLN